MEDNIIKDIRNHFRLKKEKEAIKDRVIKYIRNIFEHEEENYYQPVRVGNFRNIYSHLFSRQYQRQAAGGIFRIIHGLCGFTDVPEYSSQVIEDSARAYGHAVSRLRHWRCVSPGRYRRRHAYGAFFNLA